MLQSEVTERVTTFLGQKSALPFSILKNSDATKIINFISRKGKLRKIWGASQYSFPILTSSGAVLWLELFDYRWMFQHEGNIVLEDSEGSGTFSVVGTIAHESTPTAVNLGTELRTKQPFINAANARNRIYLVNGTEFKFFEVNPTLGNKYLNVGIFPPALGKSDADNTLTPQPGGFPVILTQDLGLGSLADATTYFYTFTWWDEVRQVESLPWGARVQSDGLWGDKATVSENTSAVNSRITVDITNAKALGYDTDRVTHWICYRATQADNSIFKKIVNGKIAIGTNFVYDSNGDETLLGVVLDETLSPPPSGKYYQSSETAIDTVVRCIGPRFVRAHRDQLFCYGVDLPGLDREDYPEVVRGVIYGSQVGNFDYWVDTYDIGRYTNQRDTGIGKYRDTLFFFKEKAAFYLDGTSPSNYEIKEIDPKRGVIAPGSIQDTPAGVIGLSVDGFCLFDSASPGSLISEEIFDEVEAINEDYLHLITSGYDPKEGKYECHCPTGTNTKNSRVFVYDINLKCWDILSTKVGASVSYGTSSNGSKKAILGDTLVARLLDITDTSEPKFNDQVIKSKWVSKNFDFNQPDKQKRLQMVTIMARANINTKLSIDVVPDFGQRETITIEDIEPDVASSTWAEDQSDEDALVWDEGNWAGDTVPVKFTTYIQCIGTNLQLIIRESQSTAAKAKFEIEEIILQANLLGNV